MYSQAYIDVRTALTTTTNTTGGDSRTGVGGVEIQKRIQEAAIVAFNNETNLVKMLRRKSGDQLAYIWNIKTETAANSGLFQTSFAFYSDGAGGTPQVNTRVELLASSKSYRTDYEVTNLMIATGMGNQLAEAAAEAASDLAIGEERSAICGSDTSAYGFANAFPGLLQLMLSYVTLGDTTTTYGIARGSGKTYLDVALVAAAATSTDALEKGDLDASITLSNKRGAENKRRTFFCSLDRRDEIDALLQAQQRFISPSIDIEGGFRVSSYRNIPIIGSRFMDKNGITYDGSTKTATHADQSMYLLCLDHLFMYHPGGVNAVHTPIVGADSYQRYDVRGGWYKTYGTFVMERFDCQVLIYNLTDI